MNILETLQKLLTESGFAGIFMGDGWKSLVMIIIACVLLYLGIVKKFEPLLLVGIAFGTVLTNLPNDGFGEEAGTYRRGVYSAKLLPESELVLRGRCLTISALKGEGTLLVVSAEQE